MDIGKAGAFQMDQYAAANMIKAASQRTTTELQSMIRSS
jgi:hypothetical protein